LLTSGHPFASIEPTPNLVVATRLLALPLNSLSESHPKEKPIDEFSIERSRSLAALCSPEFEARTGNGGSKWPLQKTSRPGELPDP
jgi:hypothetical protein